MWTEATLVVAAAAAPAEKKTALVAVAVAAVPAKKTTPLSVAALKEDQGWLSMAMSSNELCIELVTLFVATAFAFLGRFLLVFPCCLSCFRRCGNIIIIIVIVLRSLP